MKKPENFPDLVYPVCAIRDSLIGFYPATVEQSTQAAIRNFSMAVNSGNGSISFSPADFTLFHVGNFNSKKGTLEPLNPIEQLASGIQVYGEKNEKS